MAILEEMELGKVQVLVNNDSGADLAYGDIAFLNGFVGTVADHDGIADTEDGYLCINPQRLVRTDQVETGETFTAKQLCYFDPTTNTVFPDSDTDRVPLGYVEDFSDDNYVTFMPQTQNGDVVAAT